MNLNKITQRLCVATLFFFQAGTLLSQNDVRFLSVNRMFRIYRDDKPVNQAPQTEVLLRGIETDTLYVKVEFEGLEKKGVTVYLLEKGKPANRREFNYRIRFEKQVEVEFTGLYEIKPLREPIVPKKPVVDTSLKYRDTRYGHFCEMKEGKPIYFRNTPKTGPCDKPMPVEYLDYIDFLMSKAQVPQDKFNIAENTFRNNCFSISQLMTVLAYIDFELDKLKLIRLGFDHVTDPANKKSLEKIFRFESSVKELNSFFISWSQGTKGGETICQIPATETEMRSLTEKLSAASNDAQRLENFKKAYGGLCYDVPQSMTLLEKFIHDREKLEVAKLLYDRCTEKEKFKTIASVFSYRQTASELTDFIDKQQ